MKRLLYGALTCGIAAVILSGIILPLEKPAQAQNASAVGFNYVKITSNASTQVAGNTAQFHGFVVSSPGSTWTLQVFDNASACSGTAIFGATAVTVPAASTQVFFDVQAKNGICVLTAGTTPGELTIIFR